METAIELTWARSPVVLATVVKFDASRVTEARVSSGDHLQQAVIINIIITSDAFRMLPHTARIVLALTTKAEVSAAT